MTSKQPGYVYVLENPGLPGLFKVGHTYRPPYRRADELSRSTAIPSPFKLTQARFFWQAPKVEYALHQFLSQGKTEVVRQKEFFKVPLQEIQSWLETFNEEEHLSKWRLKKFKAKEEVCWSETLEGLREQWDWALEAFQHPDRAQQKWGWKKMEELSSQGWGEASWELANVWIKKGPQYFHQAYWVVEAAQRQGVHGADMRAAWIKSFEVGGFQQWCEKIDQVFANYREEPFINWPAPMKEGVDLSYGLKYFAHKN